MADPGGTFLEIGPAHNPILPKRDGFRTTVLDYLDRDGLIDKYKEHKNYSPDDIEEVDIVMPPGASMAVQIDQRFDAVVASHVLEHTTSLVSFVNECVGMLAEHGVLILIVPDKRYCFDRFRERSSLGRIIDAAENPPAVHTRGTLVDFAMNAVRHRGTTSWVAGHRGHYRFVNELPAVLDHAQRAASGRYVDVHNWVFTPHHLRLILSDLCDLGYLQVRETYFHDTVGHEFVVALRRGGTGAGLDRWQLVELADAEVRSYDPPTFAPSASA